MNVKNLNTYKKVFKGATAYITQVKQQKSKITITFAAHRHNINVLINNCTFWFLAVLVL